MQGKLKVILRLLLLAIVIPVAVWWGSNWMLSGRFEIWSDNAYVIGDIVSVAPRVAGHVTEIAIDDNVIVKKGDVLFRIDDRSYRAAFKRAEAEILKATAAIATLDAQTELQISTIQQADASLAQAEAALDLARLSFDRAKRLASAKTASVASLDAAESGFRQARAKVRVAQAASAAARKQLDLIDSQKQAAKAGLAAANAARNAARVELDSTVVTAPIAGVVGNRTLQVGRFVSIGASVLDLVSLDHLWIEVNLLETQLEELAPGQPVKVKIDSFPTARIEGVIDSISPGSGAVFSLIKPDNATGNFVRILQRVPVKIRLTKTPENLRLIPGLSAKVAIHSDRSLNEELQTAFENTPLVSSK